MERWYTLYTKPNSETRVASTFAEKGIETFLPQIWVQKGASKPFRSESLFPCYLFLRLDLNSLPPQIWQWTPGLRGIVHFAGEPAVVPDYVIETIRKELIHHNKPATHEKEVYHRGDVLRITRGPFTDLLAVFDTLMDGNTRAQVFVDFLGRLCRAKVDLNDLEKLSPISTQPLTQLPRTSRGRGRPIKTGQNRPRNS